MRLQLTRSGGFGGLRHAASVDDEALSPADRDELHRLVAEAGLWSLPPEPAAPEPPAPDRFRYRITAQDGARRHEVRAAEEAMPEPLRALVRWMEERGRPSP
jgi:hypothetical protein